MKKPSVPLDVAEDFAVHILGHVLCKKTAGKTEQEVYDICKDFHERLKKETAEYREHYAFYLATAVVADKFKKEEESASDEQNTK